MAANATAVWRVRPSGSNSNGGGYDPGIAGAGTDYSQQNAAQKTQTAGTRTTSTTTLTDTSATFTSALIGNGIHVAGTSITTTFTFITAVPSGTTLTLQTSPGTAGTAVTYNIGGAWADFYTNINTTSSPASPVVAGNTVYILGSGIPNPASYTFDYTTASNWTQVNGNATAGMITFAADPSTPSYNGTTTGGMPCISSAAYLFNGPSNIKVQLLWTVASAASAGNWMIYLGSAGCNVMTSCVVDQNGWDIGGIAVQGTVLGSEVFSSHAVRGTQTSYAFDMAQTIALGCNIHDCVWTGAVWQNDGMQSMTNCIIAKNGGGGIYIIDQPAGASMSILANCTIDANIGNGIECLTQLAVNHMVIINNIISNHVTAATYGLKIDAGTAAANSRVQGFVDYNTYYNNTVGNYNGINAGTHDVAEGTNPYVGQSTENYTLA